MRPMTRRSDPSDLESARKMVSRAERRALDRAEQLRIEAEEILKATSQKTGDTEAKVRLEYESEISALRSEMESTSRRATAAEKQLEALRPDQPQASPLPPLDAAVPGPYGAESPNVLAEFVLRMSNDAERLMAAANSAAARLHSQAALDLSRAKDEAVQVLAAATKEAEDLLTAAVAAIERDSAIAIASREQAERDGQIAAEARREADEARAQADRMRDDARRQADEMLETARAAAAQAALVARRELAVEVAGLRDAMDRVRSSFSLFLDEGFGDRDDDHVPVIELTTAE